MGRTQGYVSQLMGRIKQKWNDFKDIIYNAVAGREINAYAYDDSEVLFSGIDTETEAAIFLDWVAQDNFKEEAIKLHPITLGRIMGYACRVIFSEEDTKDLEFLKLARR